MKQIPSAVAIFSTLILISSSTFADRTSPLIIDHTCTDVNLIPDLAINQAKSLLHIAYEHASHGGQIIAGMNTLSNFPAFGSKFHWGNLPDDDTILDLHDGAMPDGKDLCAGEYL
jgi:hypothetical protein